jgi:hypothetical protein
MAVARGEPGVDVHRTAPLAGGHSPARLEGRRGTGVNLATVPTLPVNQIYPGCEQMPAQFEGWGISAIVAVTSLNPAFGHLTRLLGQPTARSGEVLGWRLRLLSLRDNQNDGQSA